VPVTPARRFTYALQFQFDSARSLQTRRGSLLDLLRRNFLLFRVCSRYPILLVAPRRTRTPGTPCLLRLEIGIATPDAWLFPKFGRELPRTWWLGRLVSIVRDAYSYHAQQRADPAVRIVPVAREHMGELVHKEDLEGWQAGAKHGRPRLEKTFAQAVSADSHERVSISYLPPVGVLDVVKSHVCFGIILFRDESCQSQAACYEYTARGFCC